MFSDDIAVGRVEGQVRPLVGGGVVVVQFFGAVSVPDVAPTVCAHGMTVES